MKAVKVKQEKESQIMSEIKTIYTDGIGKIHFFGNMIRLDLMDFVPSESDDAGSKPEPTITTRLVMSPHAFLASYESFMNMIDKLKKAGVLTAAGDGDGQDGESAQEAEVGNATSVEDVN